MNSKKLTKTQISNNEIEEIENRIKDTYGKDENSLIKSSNHFKDLPISDKTKRGLKENKFIIMTPVQKTTLTHSLNFKDILAASKTGSGKTLCFVIPVFEHLYRNKWSSLDGLGALIILPTRELAIQVFEVFKMIGKYHDFSIGMVIGGNNLEREKDNIYNMNILIGTPGRLTQHISETAYFTTDNLKILIIDEADRILDEGFEENLNEILSYLPENRQTLLFSATLTRSLKRLAKMNLRDPEYINLNNTDSVLGENREEVPSSTITPINLEQYYSIVETHEKIDILFSFLQSHKNSKCLIFVSSCKQVRFYYEIFKRLKLGMTFLELHGKQKQSKRTNIFYMFLNKKNSVLFATDIASRGVDFPNVDWVIQLDCPDDISTYIHRVGRTARYKSKGNSILFLNNKEEAFVRELQSRNIGIKKIKINLKKMVSLKPVIRSILSENSELLHLAQKSISSYIKSIYLMSNKEVFDIGSINLEEYALSCGLMNMPELKIMKKSQNDLKNKKFNEGEEDEFQEEIKKQPEQQTNQKKSKLQKLKEKIQLKKLEKAKERDNDDDFLKKKRNVDDDINISSKPDQKHVPDVLNDDEIDDYYSKIKNKLEINKVEDKIKEKARIFDKHKKDRLKRKERDYQKHGIENDEDNNSEHNENNEYEETEKINIKTATIEEKEDLALKLLKSNKLFR